MEEFKCEAWPCSTDKDCYDYRCPLIKCVNFTSTSVSGIFLQMCVVPPQPDVHLIDTNFVSN